MPVLSIALNLLPMLLSLLLPLLNVSFLTYIVSCICLCQQPDICGQLPWVPIFISQVIFKPDDSCWFHLPQNSRHRFHEHGLHLTITELSVKDSASFT